MSNHHCVDKPSVSLVLPHLDFDYIKIPLIGLTLTLMIFALILTWSFGFYQNHLVYYCMHFGSKPIPSLISRTPKKRNLFSESMGKHKKFGSVTSNSCIHIITSWRELWACRYCFLIFVQLFQIVQDILT